MERHSFSPYANKKAPTIFYGMWGLGSLKRHKGLGVVVWRGSDILKSLGQLPDLRKRKNIKHVAISHFIASDLKKAGLKYKFIPIVSKDLTDFKPVPLGDEIYTYAPDYNPKYFIRYGQDIINQVQDKCKYKINIIRSSSQFSKKEMIKVYGRCFCSFRFTKHDGLPNQVAEMSAMGRRSFYNGDLPGSIKWSDDISEILKNIEKEAQLIGTTNDELSIEMKEYANIGNDWLNIKFWE